MIRINLLKKTVKRQRVVRKRVTFQFPVKQFAIAACIILSVGLVGASLWFLRPYLHVSHKTSGPVTVDEKLKPSTYTKSQVVEEVVLEQDDTADKLKESGLLELPYNELSLAERINYQIHFAKNVCDLLSQTVPKGVGFRKLTAYDFRHVDGTTLTASRELITEMLKSMRGRRVQFSPRPQSVITKSGTGYQFAFSSEIEFGLNLKAAFIDLELRHLASRENLAYTLKKFVHIAEANGIHSTGLPQQISADADGRMRLFHYKYSATASYVDFVRFVTALHEERVPCAFEKLELTAQTKERLTVEAQLLFTTLN